MKKSLIALAVLAASGAAFAQSTVTMYGLANIGVAQSTGNKAALAGGVDGNDSRVGFRGKEDLGGGLSALFNYEMGFNLATGQFDNAQAAGVATRVFQRQAYMGLGGGSGTVTFGRQNTISGKSVFWFMPNYYTNATTAVGLGYGGVGPSRSDATIQYTSPNLSGVTVKLGTQLGGNQTSTLTGSAQGLTEVGVDYANGPVQAHFAYAQRSTIAGGGSSLSLNGGYDFGPARVIVAYADLAGTGTGKGFTLGVDGKLGAFSPYLQVARNTDTKVTAYDVGSYYSLSKRTNVYAMVGRNTTTDITKTGAGISHSF